MEVAVKIIPADNPADLLKEVDIMLACTSPYIVRLHDCFYKVSVLAQLSPVRLNAAVFFELRRTQILRPHETWSASEV